VYLFTNPYRVWFASLGAVTSEDDELLYIVQVLCLVSAGERINIYIVMTVVFVCFFYLTFVLDIYLSFMFVITIVVTVVLAFLFTVVMMIATSNYWLYKTQASGAHYYSRN
jgi:hypothetical protein